MAALLNGMVMRLRKVTSLISQSCMQGVQGGAVDRPGAVHNPSHALFPADILGAQLVSGCTRDPLLPSMTCAHAIATCRYSILLFMLLYDNLTCFVRHRLAHVYGHHLSHCACRPSQLSKTAMVSFDDQYLTAVLLCARDVMEPVSALPLAM